MRRCTPNESRELRQSSISITCRFERNVERLKAAKRSDFISNYHGELPQCSCFGVPASVRKVLESGEGESVKPDDPRLSNIETQTDMRL